MTRLSLLLAATLAVPAIADDPPVELRIATIAPEGSTWVKVFREADDELRSETRGRVGFKYYPGGILGDEPAVIRKMNEGRVDGSALSGLGIGELLPEIRILELPLAFESYEEYDHVVRGLYRTLSERLAAKGWKLMGLAEGGFACLWSERPVRSLAELRSTRVWCRADDPMAERTFRALGIEALKTPLSDVVPGFEAGRIETVYSSPLSLLAFQWFPHLRYRIPIDLFNLQAAYVIRAESFARIPPEYRDDVERIAARHVARLVAKTREDNREALAIIAKKGIETVALDRESLGSLRSAADRMGEDLAGDLYDRELYDAMLTLRRGFREGR